MNVKDAVLDALAKAENGEFVSGGLLSEFVGVSRNSVWKAVKSLEAEGFLFEAATNKGYRLHPENNALSEILISHGVEENLNIHVFREIDSTNNHAKELASCGAEDGTVIVSDMQSAGKGRLGRSFSSPSGTGLYMSMIIRPKIALETAQLITSCAAVATAEAIEKLCGNDVSVKWVNDLYMNGRKICGILTEASLSLETRSLDYAVIGIGINVRSIKNIFDAELSSTATSVEDETGVKLSRSRLCSEIINNLRKRLADIESKDFLKEYRRREILTGNQITASVGGEQIIGTAVGIDDNAGLLVKMSDGEIKSFSSGEANLCRIKKI